MLCLDIQSDAVSCEEKVSNVELKTSFFEKRQMFWRSNPHLGSTHANRSFLGTLAKIDTISGYIVH